MREITSHIVNPVNDKLKITVLDEPGSGGANHRYDITGFNTDENKSAIAGGYKASFSRLIVLFQNGPIGESGVNGITQEALIAVCIDRLECFQAGPFASDYNAKALASLKEAQGWLMQRTRDRMARGVEGKTQA